MSDPQLRNLQRDWEDLGSIDPLWAILWDNARRHGGWDLAEFMATGEVEIEDLMARATSFGLPVRHDRALDFGCGIGRLTRALATVFDETVGVDISGTMIDYARRINADRNNCSFVHNVQRDLSILADASFDLVYTNIVLQHLPDRDVAEGYVLELVRVLRPGGLLVFQIPDRIPLRHRLRPRRRLYHALRGLGLGAVPLYRRFGLHPIRMIDLPEDRAVRIVTAAGGKVLAIDAETLDDTMEDRTYYVGRVEGIRSHGPGIAIPPPTPVRTRRNARPDTISGCAPSPIWPTIAAAARSRADFDSAVRGCSRPSLRHSRLVAESST